MSDRAARAARQGQALENQVPNQPLQFHHEVVLAAQRKLFYLHDYPTLFTLSI